MFSTSHPGRAKVIVPILIIVLVILVIFLDARRRSAEARLTELSLQYGQTAGDQQQNRERAAEIVAKVKAHMALDTSVEPTVASIVDVAKLRQSNPFYDKAENGDYLVITPTRAVLYSEKEDVILDVVPVQLEEPAQGSVGSVSSARSSARATAVSSAAPVTSAVSSAQ